MGGGGVDGGSPSETGGYQNFTREVSLSDCFHCRSVVGISVFISQPGLFRELAATIFYLVLTHEEETSVNDASVETFAAVY